jgi:hypothetical protein
MLLALGTSEWWQKIQSYRYLNFWLWLTSKDSWGKSRSHTKHIENTLDAGNSSVVIWPIDCDHEIRYICLSSANGDSHRNTINRTAIKLLSDIDCCNKSHLWGGDSTEYIPHNIDKVTSNSGLVDCGYAVKLCVLSFHITTSSKSAQNDVKQWLESLKCCGYCNCWSLPETGFSPGSYGKVSRGIIWISRYYVEISIVLSKSNLL